MHRTRRHIAAQPGARQRCRRVGRRARQRRLDGPRQRRLQRVDGSQPRVGAKVLTLHTAVNAAVAQEQREALLRRCALVQLQQQVHQSVRVIVAPHQRAVAATQVKQAQRARARGQHKGERLRIHSGVVQYQLLGVRPEARQHAGHQQRAQRVGGERPPARKRNERHVDARPRVRVARRRRGRQLAPPRAADGGASQAVAQRQRAEHGAQQLRAEHVGGVSQRKARARGRPANGHEARRGASQRRCQTQVGRVGRGRTRCCCYGGGVNVAESERRAVIHADAPATRRLLRHGRQMAAARHA
jgi:hypothetical protein